MSSTTLDVETVGKTIDGEFDNWTVASAGNNGELDVITVRSTESVHRPFERGVDVVDLATKLEEFGFTIGYVRNGPEVQFLRD